MPRSPTGVDRYWLTMSRTHDYRGMFDTAGTRAPRESRVTEVAAEPGLVVEDPASGFCGAVVTVTGSEVTLEDRFGGRRIFPLRPAGFLYEGRPATLVRPQAAPAGRTLSASGSVHVANLKARTARAASRLAWMSLMASSSSWVTVPSAWA